MRVPPLLLEESKRALPYALLLAFALGAVVTAGAHYSNAWPSESRPFGWSGPASFENAVAMVRSDLVLAASLPALVLGARALARREPAREGPRVVVPVYALHALLLALGVLVATALGAWGAAKNPFDALFAFWTAHVVLALSFYSIGFVWSCYLREHAIAGAAAIWIAFLGLYEAVTRTILFRTEGYAVITSGFPDWFWVAQGLSPLSSYTGILILWRPRFRDYMEAEVLKDAVLPGWLVPASFVALAALLWMLLPLALGTLGWWWRGRRASPAAAGRASKA